MANGRKWRGGIRRGVAGVALTGGLVWVSGPGLGLAGAAPPPPPPGPASLGDPVAWPTDAEFTAYTSGGFPIRDAAETATCKDPSTGGTAPTGSNDIFSGTPNCAVSPQGALSSTYFRYDRVLDRYFFRFRVIDSPLRGNAAGGGVPQDSDPFTPVTYNLLLDSDGDGYKEFSVVLNGDYGSNNGAYDRIEVYYSDNPTQTVSASDLVAAGTAVTVGTGYKSGNVWNFGPTRVTDDTANGGGYLVDFQVPGRALVNQAGIDLISPATPLSLTYTTAVSNIDPLQKDVAFGGRFSSNDRVPGGDTVIGDGTVQAPVTTSLSVSGSCPGPLTLSGRVQDRQLVTPDGLIVTTSVQAVSFEYRVDANADGVPDPDASWIHLADATRPDPARDLDLWTATVQPTVLPLGVPVLIRLSAVDDAGNVGYSAFSPPDPALPDRFVVFTSSCGTPVPNRGPVAAGDGYTTAEDTALVVAAPGLLANDSDPDGDALAAQVLTGPTNGMVSMQGDGSFVYTPARDYSGPDSFTYTVSDGKGGSATGTVTLTVRPVNDAPVAGGDGYVTDEDTVLTIAAPGVLANDSDVDSSSLSATIATPPANGTVTLDPDGSFAYTPNRDFSGIDSFTYTVSDGSGGSTTGIVTITVNAVNDAPVAGGDGYVTDEDTVLTIADPGVLANDTDLDSSTLTVTLAGGPTNGTVTLDPDGSFVYSPNRGFAGTDSFTYTVSDGSGGTATATVTLTVRANPEPLAVVAGSVIREVTAVAEAGPAPAPAPARATPVQPATLPRTGADSTQLAKLGSALVLLGAALRGGAGSRGRRKGRRRRRV